MVLLVELYEKDISYKFIKFNDISLVVSRFKRMYMRFNMNAVVDMVKFDEFTWVD